MISDSMCGASHAKMMAAHPGMTDSQCTLGCVKDGAKYVFVSKGKIYQIANQNQADLAKEAGESVSLTGDVNGNTITVSKVMMEKKN
jgi:cellobiose phosphorylase